MALRRPLSVILPVLPGRAVLFSPFARAQDSTAHAARAGDAERGKIVFQSIGSGVTCHGRAGDGQGGRNPRARTAGANLHETELDAEGLTEVIKGGIPGTQTPEECVQVYGASADKACCSLRTE